MKVLFVKPNMILGHPGDAMEPLVFGILSALTPPAIERSLIDERVEPMVFDEPADLVAITTDTFSAKRSYQVAAAYRALGIPVVMGGFHPSLCPSEAADHADAVVIGDGEDTWPRILRDFQAGTLRPVYRSTLGRFGRVAPDRAIFKGKNYAPVQLVEHNRGCRYACEFCSIRAMYRGKIRQADGSTLLDVLRRRHRRHVVFTDDNLFSDESALCQLLEMLKGLDVRWSCQVSADVTLIPDLVASMAESGCVSVTVGLESLDQDNLSQMRKSWMGADQRAAIRVFHQHGIMVYGTFVIGYDHDDLGVFDEVLKFAVDTRLFLANFNPLTPTPGTPLYERLAAEGRLLFDRWWLDPRYRYGDCVFQPRRMTPGQVRDSCFRVRREFNRLRSLWTRMPGLPFRHWRPYKASIFLAANLVSRREINRKQGRPLGDTSGSAAIVGLDKQALSCT